MEIQAIGHNELSVSYRIAGSEVDPPDFTLNSQYVSFKTDLKPTTLVKGTFQLIFCSIPPILTICTIFLQNFVNVYYAVSTQDTNLINAFGLGMTFLGVFGYNLVFAFNNNLIALIAQAHGARDPFAVGVHFQRGLVFQIPLFILLIIAICFAKQIFVIFGVDNESEVMIQAISFVKWSSLSVLLSGIFDIGRIYLCGQNYFSLPFYIKLAITVLNTLMAEMLVGNHKLVGLAIARNISDVVGVLLLYFFIARLKLNSWIKPTLMMMSKWWEYFKFIFPGGLALYLHFLYIECLMIFVGNLHNPSALSAHVSFVNVRPLLFAIPLGTAVSVTSFVGQSIGENAKKKAQTAALMGVIACNIYFGIQILAGYWLLNPIKSFLSISDENEGLQFDIIFNLYIFFIIFVESHQYMFAGIMKGLGQLSYNLRYYLIGFYLIGLPLTYFLGLFWSLGLQGIWISYLVSNFVVCLFQVAFFVTRDWDTFLMKGIDLDNDIEIPLIDFDPKPKQLLNECSEQNTQQTQTNNQDQHLKP